jgi:hypothetical protein
MTDGSYWSGFSDGHWHTLFQWMVGLYLRALPRDRETRSVSHCDDHCRPRWIYPTVRYQKCLNVAAMTPVTGNRIVNANLPFATRHSPLAIRHFGFHAKISENSACGLPDF